MPQADPTSVEALYKIICESVMLGCVSHTALIAKIEERDAQRDRETLTKAAERMCLFRCSVTRDRCPANKDSCGYSKAILADQ